MKVSKREAGMTLVHLRGLQSRIETNVTHLRNMIDRGLLGGLDELIESTTATLKKESRRLDQLLAGGSSDLSEDNNYNNNTVKQK